MNQNAPAQYEKPAIISYTEEELVASIEGLGTPSDGTGGGGGDM